MSKLTFVVTFALALAGFHVIDIAAQPVVGEQDLILVVYRHGDGQLTRESKRFAKEMSAKATRAGHIKLWLTANLAFNPYLDQLADEEIEEQDRRVAQFIQSGAATPD